MTKRSDVAVERITNFKVDSRLLSELGERLVARRSVALAELIKNAYDADATEVVVTVEEVTKPHGVILIKDNGTGMTFEEFQSGWMRIATPDKVRRPRSRVFGRATTGSKGIGRFACHRLASKLHIVTTAVTRDGFKEQLSATFDWDQFRAGQDIDTVQIPITRSRVGSEAQTGTSLRLESVREVWNESDVAELRRDLVSLVSPFPRPRQSEERPGGIQTDPGFRIRLVCPEFPKYEGTLEEQLLSQAWGVLEGAVVDGGQPRYTLRIRGGSKLKFQPSVQYPKPGPTTFKIHFFVYTAKLFRGLDIDIVQARQIGRESGGVRVYQDGFRVFTYGQPGDDWLGLDADRSKRLVATPEPLKTEAEGLARPMLLLPGNNQIFGVVRLSKETNPNILINMSRERLVENDAYSELRTFVRLGIDWMTVQYARWRLVKEPSAGALRKAPDPVESLGQALEKVRKSKSLEPRERREILSSLSETRRALTLAQRERIEERSLLQIMASAGNMVLIFNHEIRALLDDMKAILFDLRAFAAGIGAKYKSQLTQSIARIERWVDMIEQQGIQLGLLLGREARQQRRRLAVREMIEDLKKAFSHYLQEEGIEFVNAVKPSVRTAPMYPAELYSIFVNLMTNALKAVKEQKIAHIEVEGTRKNGSILLFFKDTGVGVPAEMRETVFEPFVSTSVPDPLLGAGTGLGLKIVRDLVEKYGGSVRFVEPTKPWKACVELILPGD